MNLFATSQCHVQSAKDHCNVHCTKLIVEVCQMLSTAHFVLDGEQVGYKPTHQGHPCSKWIRQTSENYQWAYNHLKALCAEYTFRTGKVHKTSELLKVLGKLPAKIEIAERTDFAMAMPDQFKLLGIYDQTNAYKAYLNSKFAEWVARPKPMKVEWANRGKPDWVNI